MTRSNSASFLFAAAMGLALTAAASSADAGEVHGFSVGVTLHAGHHQHHPHYHALPYPRPHVHHGHSPYRGPALYYSYYYDHIPAYPVPVFKSYHPPVMHHRTVVVGISGAHAAWCHAHYRSYRAHDISFQPHHGPRRQCRSPYH